MIVYTVLVGIDAADFLDARDDDGSRDGDVLVDARSLSREQHARIVEFHSELKWEEYFDCNIQMGSCEVNSAGFFRDCFICLLPGRCCWRGSLGGIRSVLARRQDRGNWDWSAGIAGR